MNKRNQAPEKHWEKIWIQNILFLSCQTLYQRQKKPLLKQKTKITRSLASSYFKRTKNPRCKKKFPSYESVLTQSLYLPFHRLKRLKRDKYIKNNVPPLLQFTGTNTWKIMSPPFTNSKGQIHKNVNANGKKGERLTTSIISVLNPDWFSPRRTLGVAAPLRSTPPSPTTLEKGQKWIRKGDIFIFLRILFLYFPLFGSTPSLTNKEDENVRRKFILVLCRRIKLLQTWLIPLYSL